MKIFFNGEYVEEKDCEVSPFDRGFTIADGIFDTMLCENGQLIFAKEHYERLQRHAKAVYLELDFDFEFDFSKAAKKLLEVNDFTKERYALRTTITRGPAERGLLPPAEPKPTITMSAHPAPLKTDPVDLMICENIRRNENSPLSRIKSLSYGENMLALMQAKEKNVDDAVLLNSKGNICCTTTSNIYIMEGRRMVTPPLEDGVLDGVFRQSLIEKRKPREESINTERLLKADAVFLTNSIQGIRPVKQVNESTYAYITVLTELAA